MYESVHSPTVKVKSTGLAGHKVWIRCEGGAFFTLYVVRVPRKEGKRSNRSLRADRLAVVAIDAVVFMQDDVQPTSQRLDIQECAICLERMDGACLWKCEACGNCLHLACVRDWVTGKQSCSCPYCRSEAQSVSL